MQIPIPVDKLGTKNITWSSQYNPGADKYEELADLIRDAANQTIGKTEFGPALIKTDVVSISPAHKNNT